MMTLVSTNEESEMKAQKEFYAQIEAQMGSQRAKRLAFWKRVSIVYNPMIALSFVAVYWIVGLKHAELI